jgi:hypothetical protein
LYKYLLFFQKFYKDNNKILSDKSCDLFFLKNKFKKTTNKLTYRE